MPDSYFGPFRGRCQWSNVTWHPPGDGQLAGWHWAGDDGTGANGGTLAHFDRGHKLVGRNSEAYCAHMETDPYPA